MDTDRDTSLTPPTLLATGRALRATDAVSL
jgi:hypothetical protein